MTTQRIHGHEKVPMYGVWLLNELPLGGKGGMIQEFPSANELALCAKRFPRVVAAFEVLTVEYHKSHPPEKAPCP